jgi:hypothetical protein
MNSNNDCLKRIDTIRRVEHFDVLKLVSEVAPSRRTMLKSVTEVSAT